MAISRILFKYNVGEEVVDKPRAYAMWYAMYEEVFENWLIEKLVS